jgi:hypothetical protein
VNPGSMANAKLSPGAVKTIRLFSAKYSYTEMAKLLRVHRTTVSRAARAVTRPASPPGSTAQGAPTAHQSNRSADLAQTVCKSPCAPASTSRIKASEPSRRR